MFHDTVWEDLKLERLSDAFRHKLILTAYNRWKDDEGRDMSPEEYFPWKLAFTKSKEYKEEVLKRRIVMEFANSYVGLRIGRFQYHTLNRTPREDSELAIFYSVIKYLSKDEDCTTDVIATACQQCLETLTAADAFADKWWEEHKDHPGKKYEHASIDELFRVN